MEKRYKILKRSNSIYGKGFSFEYYITILKKISHLTFAMDTGIYKTEEEKNVSDMFYYKYTTPDIFNNPYSYIAYNTHSNTITAVSSGRENSEDLSIFLEVANKLDAELWSYTGKFIVTQEYIDHIKSRESNVVLTNKQKIALDEVEFNNNWFLFKSLNNIDLLQFIDDKEKSYEYFEDCMRDVLRGNKIIYIIKDDWVLLMGRNVYCINYKDREDFKNTSNFNIKLIDFLNIMSTNKQEAMFFTSNMKYSSFCCVRSINGELFYANFPTEENNIEYFGIAANFDIPIIPIDFEETNALEVCRNWSGIIPEDILIKVIDKKEKVMTFWQENYAIPQMN